MAGEGVTNVYDGFGLLVSSSSDMGGTARSVGNFYDLDGNRVRITHPDTGYFTYEADGLGRPVMMRENGGQPIVAFAYDSAGRRASSGWAATTSYAYDGVGRLKTLSHDLAGTSRDHVLGFTYNAASQIQSRSASNEAYAWTGAANTVRNYAANGLNQYTSAGPATFAYDLNGNLTSTANPPSSTSYVYDVENRLVSASGTENATLAYDPLGRLWQVVSTTTGTRRLVYDGDALIAEYDTSGYMNHRYIHGNDAGDDPLIWYDNAASGWRRALLTDHQGSIIEVADLNGNPIATNSYDAWGIPGAGNVGRFGYTGQAWVPELGLWYYKTRFYSPTTGRFLQVDPVGYKDQMNLYAYVGNDPVNRADPSGTTCTEVGEQKGGAAKYACRIDSVAIVDSKGNLVGKRDPTEAENKKFAAFNARYTAAVNRLMRNPDKAVTVAAIHDKLGSFQTSAGQAAASMISREFMYIGKWNSDSMMVSPGVYSPQTGRVEGAATWVLQSGLKARGVGIVHDGGLHATPEEWTGGLQAFPSPLSKYEHQTQYNNAACKLLGETNCEP